MANETTPPPGSLVLAVDAADMDPEAVELSILIAARERRPLLLVTVERADWATAAGLPVTQMVRGHDLRTESVDLAGMERMLGRWSARTAARILELAGRHGVALRHERRRGRLDIALTQTMGPEDWLSVVLPASPGERAEDLKAIVARAAGFRHPLMISPRLRRGRRPVVLAYAGGEAALRRAVLLASLRGGGLRIWTIDGADLDPVRKAAADAHVPVEFETVAASDLPDRLASAQAAAVVLDRHGDGFGQIDLSRIAGERMAIDLCLI